MIENVNVRVTPAAATDIRELKRCAASALGVSMASVNDVRVVRRSIDARKRNIQIDIVLRCAVGDDREVGACFTPVEFSRVADGAPVLLVVGAGPAGLFCALEAIRHGIRPIVLEHRQQHHPDTQRHRDHGDALHHAGFAARRRLCHAARYE